MKPFPRLLTVFSCLLGLALALPAAAQASYGDPAQTQAQSASPPELVDLNAASREQLMTLPGIRGASADKIIAGRPYKAKADLVRRRILSRTAYNRIAGRVVVNPPAAPATSSLAAAAGKLAQEFKVPGSGAPPADSAAPAAASTSGSGGGLGVDKIAAGLKQALAVSTANAVAETGKPDGFLGNPAIHIPLPDKLRTLGSGARMLGMGSQVDALEVAMNRAAEQATPQAKQIFLDALTRMSFTDARNILAGGDTAATDYFKAQTSAQLTTAFTPIVHDTMEKVGVIRQYDALTQSPLAGSLGQGFNLDAYVVGKTLDGLFYMLGQEEKKIRTNPAAQTTSLLKEVFGRKP